MDIQTILAKLAPLLPEQVARWRRTLQIAEPEVKALLERQVRLNQQHDGTLFGETARRGNTLYFGVKQD